MHLEGQVATEANRRGDQRMLRQRLSSDRGYAMAALLVSIGIMGVLASVVMPVWKQQAKREREAELIFRAGQYAHAVELFKRKTANQYPPDLDILVKQRFLRKKYKDPMTKNGEWRIVTPAELQGTPMGGSMPGLAGQQGGGFNNGRSSFGTGSPGQGSGLGQSGGGFGRPSMPGGQPSAPSAGGQNPGQQQPQPGDPNAPSGGPGSPSSFGSASGRGPVNLGPVATVASRSTEKSLLVFKGRERYDQWIVTIEDVMKRQVVNPQQQGQQPGQQGRPGSTPFGNRPNSGQTPSSMPSGFPTSSPSSSSPPRR